MAGSLSHRPGAPEARLLVRDRLASFRPRRRPRSARAAALITSAIMIARRWLAAACASLVLGLPAIAAAQDVAAAETLFNRGMEHMEAGDFEKACPAIGESYRLDPRAGTLFTLAECEARRGRVVAAYVRYGEYLALYDGLPADKKARQGGRPKAAREQLAALKPQVPELALVLVPGVPPGTTVKRDGVPVGEASLGIGLPVEPGEHVIVVQVPGKPPLERRIQMGAGDKKQILLDDKPPPPEPPRPAVKAPPPIVSAPVPAPVRAGPSPRRVAAYALGGAGIAGVVVGGVLGGLALSKKSGIDAACRGVGFADPRCSSKLGPGRTLGNGSTAGLSVGGGLLVPGVVLFFTEPAADPRRAGASVGVGVLDVDDTGAVAGVRGGF